MALLICLSVIVHCILPLLTVIFSRWFQVCFGHLSNLQVAAGERTNYRSCLQWGHHRLWRQLHAGSWMDLRGKQAKHAFMCVIEHVKIVHFRKAAFDTNLILSHVLKIRQTTESFRKIIHLFTLQRQNIVESVLPVFSISLKYIINLFRPKSKPVLAHLTDRLCLFTSRKTCLPCLNVKVTPILPSK